MQFSRSLNEVSVRVSGQPTFTMLVSILLNSVKFTTILFTIIGNDVSHAIRFHADPRSYVRVYPRDLSRAYLAIRSFLTKLFWIVPAKDNYDTIEERSSDEATGLLYDQFVFKTVYH